jgi:hypothetical protein
MICVKQTEWDKTQIRQHKESTTIETIKIVYTHIMHYKYLIKQTRKKRK